MSGPDLKGLLNGAANGWLTRRAYTDRMRREAKREGWWWLRERGRALSRGAPLVAGWSVVWPNLGRAELVPLEIAAAGPGDVTIEIAASVVSPGTERAQYLGLANTSIEFPGRPGYSAAGVVRRVGRGVSGLRPGDLVATAAAAHASVATVPADRVHRVPAGVDAPAAATVGLGVIAALGVRRARIAPGERACVVGAGPIGLLAQRLAAAAGAGECVVVATTRRREEAVVRGGARLVPAGDRDALQALGCPVVIEATGDAAALSTAIAAAGPGGRVVLLGSARGGTAELALADLQTRGIRLVGAHIDLLALESRRSGADAHRAEAQGYLRALADGAVTVDDLVAEGVDPREADAYYRRLGHGRTTAIRFAWDALPAAMRPRRGRLTRLPDVGARGIEPGRGRLATRADDGPFALPDPFAGAEGDLRLGFIGCGDIALQNAAAAASAPNVSPVACYDPVRPLAEDLARRFGMRVAATSEALLAGEDIDAVVIATPHHLHAPLALQAIAAGAHVIVEKPMAERLAPAREMVDAAERAGVVLTTMFVARYEPRAMVARRLIAAGAIGAPRGLSLTFLTDKPLSYWHAGASGRARSSWRGVRELAGGGVLIMNLCHCLDLARWLLQDDGERVLAADASATERPGVEDMVALTVRYRGGALGSFVGACDVPGVWEERPATDFHLWGSEGHLLLEPEPALYTRIALDGLRSSRWHGFPPMPRLSQRALFLSRLATSLARGEPPEVTAAEALAVQEIIEEAYGSAGLVPPVGVDARELVRP